MLENVKVAQIKNSKNKVHLFSNFASGRTLPTHKNVYEGLNARPKVYLSEEYFCEMYPTCVSSKLCEFIK